MKCIRYVHLHGHKQAKRQIERVIGQWITWRSEWILFWI